VTYQGPANTLWFDEIDSTSSEARRRLQSGLATPVWIAAHGQTSGRGRLGRIWHSLPGNLYTTYVLPLASLNLATRLPFAAGLAVARTCQSYIEGERAELKWPNDVRVNGAKLSGILVETIRVDQTYWAMIGIGINVAHAPSLTDAQTTCLSQLSSRQDITAQAVLNLLQTRLPACIQLACENFTQVIADWSMCAEGLGSMIEAGPAENRVRGIFTGLDPEGGLILRLPDGSEQLIRTGEIDLVKQVG